MSNFEQVHFTVIEQQVFTKSEILKKKTMAIFEIFYFIQVLQELLQFNSYSKKKRMPIIGSFNSISISCFY